MGLQSIFVCRHSDYKYTRLWSVNDVATWDPPETPWEPCRNSWGFPAKRPDCISSPRLSLLFFIYIVQLEIQLIWSFCQKPAMAWQVPASLRWVLGSSIIDGPHSIYWCFFRINFNLLCPGTAKVAQCNLYFFLLLFFRENVMVFRQNHSTMKRNAIKSPRNNKPLMVFYKSRIS